MLASILIYTLLPVLGLLFYTRLVRKMIKENSLKPPFLSLLVVCSTQGGLLLVLLSDLCGYWSFMASLGTVYLIIIAPVIMAYIASSQYKNRILSVYHHNTYKAALYYFISMPVVGIILLLKHNL